MLPMQSTVRSTSPVYRARQFYAQKMGQEIAAAKVAKHQQSRLLAESAWIIRLDAPNAKSLPILQEICAAIELPDGHFFLLAHLLRPLIQRAMSNCGNDTAISEAGRIILAEIKRQLPSTELNPPQITPLLSMDPGESATICLAPSPPSSGLQKDETICVPPPPAARKTQLAKAPLAETHSLPVATTRWPTWLRWPMWLLRLLHWARKTK